MLKQNIVDFGNATDKGKIRDINEDYYAFYPLSEDSVLAIVCDGMGGHKAGEIASHEAVDTIYNHFKTTSNKKSTIEDLRSAFLEANDKIFHLSTINPEQSGMGTTAVVILIKNDIAYLAHVGDSRIYRVRGSKIKQLTKDNSYVQQMLDNGLIHSDEAKKHPKRNIILKAIGIENHIEPEISEPISILKDDIFILCTDGLTEYLQDKEIKDFVLNHNPNKASQLMVDLANKRGGKDNITVQIIKILKGNTYTKSTTEKLQTVLLSYWLSIPILIASIILIYFVFFTSDKIVNNKHDIKKRDSIKVLNNDNSQTNIDSNKINLVDSINKNHSNTLQDTNKNVKPK